MRAAVPTPQHGGDHDHRTRTTETATQAYERNLRAARAPADLIADHVRAVDLGDPRPASLHWGDVGDMAETVRGLQEVSDRLFAEGEHAEEA